MNKIEAKIEMHNKKQMGFTLIEIAIVLVIIGLLLGGILKGQELINSARVRSMADQNSGIQAAYFGFIDRFRQIPGDMDEVKAGQAIGQEIHNGGDGNGRIDNTVAEAVAVWEHLTKSNFIGSGFTPATNVVTDINDYAANAPRNAFNSVLVLTRNDGYAGASPVERLSLHMGRDVPVSIARELDIKIDDSFPNTGVLRLTSDANTTTDFNTADFFTAQLDCTATAASTAASPVAGSGTESTDIYNIFVNQQNCGPVYIY